MTHSYIKKLKLFDPKSDLQVDESFRNSLGSGSQNSIDSLLQDGTNGPNEDSGKEICTYKTTDAITSSISRMQVPGFSETFFLAGNKKGNSYLLHYPSGSSEFQTIWKIQLPGTLYKEPAIRDNMLYYVTREGAIFALAIQADVKLGLKGIRPKVIWKKALPKGVLTAPTLSRKMLIIASLAGLHAIDIYGGESSEGKVLWNKPLSGIVSSPEYDAGQLFVGTEEKRLISFSDKGDSIAEQWVLETNDAVRMKPYVSKNGKFVLAASIDGTMYCLERNTGKINWIFIAHAPLYGDVMSQVENGEELYYFGSDAGDFFCVDSSGKERWRFRTNGKIRSKAIISGEKIFFGCHDNHIYSLDRAKGSIVYKFSTDGNIYGEIQEYDNALIFGSGDSFVYAIRK